jgi:hypothetical protein
MANDMKEVRSALARAVAQRKVSKDAINEVAESLAAAKHRIRGINVCERGICIDFILDNGDWLKQLPGIVEMKGGRFRGIEVFPWGIPFPDIVHVRVMQEFEQTM